MWDGAINRRAMGVAALALIIGLGGCRGEPVEPPPGSQPGEPEMEVDAGSEPGLASASTARGDVGVRAVKIGGVRNLSHFGNVYFAGQPAMEDFEKLRDRGVATVINLRSEGEMEGIPERRTVEGLGMAYHHVPIDGPASLTDETLARIRRLLRQSEGEPTLVHCASATRVGAAWLASRVLDDGAPWDAAAAEAKKIGLSSEAYRRRVREYVERQRGE